MPELILTLRLLLTGLLYGFLVLTLYVIWRDLKAHTQEESSPYESATLVAETPATTDQRVALRPVTAIGRGSDNHLIVDDPFASANHAIVAWREDRWWLEDLNSHNGTYLNGVRIDKPHPLTSGDRIAIGETILRFETDIG